jgi:hypothetical protein
MACPRAHSASLCALLCALGLSGPVWAQDADRIWGRVYTKSGDVHEGFIRWDQNQASWVDVLGGSKQVPGENYVAWLASKDAEGPPLRTIDLHEFQILRFREPDPVVGYDAFDGGRLLVGTVVTQSGEEIDGVIRWDADEAASWEMLNGRADDVDFTIEFAHVSRIERGEVFGATVTLLDGRTFELDDSNDVDWDNKGILIHPEGASGGNGAGSSRWRVIAWDEFREVRFRQDSPGPGGGLESARGDGASAH